MQRPDHNTLNRFRSGMLQGVLREVFSQVVLLLAEEGLLDLKKGYTDGTKLESAANKYTFVWAKGIKTNKERIEKQLKEL
jgi:transposase